MTSDGRVAATISHDQLRGNDNAHELLFMIGENELLRNFPEDGFQQPQWWSKIDQLQQMPDDNVDETANPAPLPNHMSDTSGLAATSQAADAPAQASNAEDDIPRQTPKEGTTADTELASDRPNTNAAAGDGPPSTNVDENGMEDIGEEISAEEEDVEDDVKWPSRAFRVSTMIQLKIK